MTPRATPMGAESIEPPSFKAFRHASQDEIIEINGRPCRMVPILVVLPASRVHLSQPSDVKYYWALKMWGCPPFLRDLPGPTCRMVAVSVLLAASRTHISQPSDVKKYRALKRSGCQSFLRELPAPTLYLANNHTHQTLKPLHCTPGKVISATPSSAILVPLGD
jgi:hypothetical protein